MGVYAMTRPGVCGSGTHQGTLGWIEEDRFIATGAQRLPRIGSMRTMVHRIAKASYGSVSCGEMPALYYKDKADRLRASNLYRVR